MYFFLLLVGLLGLWVGTEITISGSLSIAQRLGLSEFIVGVAILSIGSDIPELAIAIDGAMQISNGMPVSDVIIGSALGSGLAQIGLVLGITGLFGYLTLPKAITYQHGGLLLGSLVLLGLFGFDGHLSRIEGLSLITVYIVYLIFILSDHSVPHPENPEAPTRSLAKSLLYLSVGLLTVFTSAKLTISAVIQIADILQIEKSFLSVVVVGLGSSLPELSISLGAVLKGKSRLSVGNLIGSNIFDTLIPIGVAATISELSFNRGFLYQELPILFLVSALVLIFFVREKGIQKPEAISIVSLYMVYLIFKLMQL